MKRSQFERWLQQIQATQEEEISCSECFNLVSQYVDREIAGEPVAERLPRVRHHLDECRACREEYETLRDLTRLDAEGRAPTLEDLQKAF